MKGNGRLALVTTALALGLVALLHSDAAATIAFVKNIGTATGNNTGTTITITLQTGVSVAAGNSIILSFVSADIGTTFSATDSASNGYSVDIQGVKTGTGSVRTVILSAHNVSALAAGNTITVTFPSTTSRRVLTADEFSGLAKSGTLDKTSSAGSSGTTPDSGFTATTTQAAELLLGAIGVAGANSDTFTAGDDGHGGTYTALTRVNSGGNIFYVNPEYEIVAATNTYKARATITSQNWAANIATYKGDANCGNGMVDAGEDCDAGSSNGTASSCCSASCRFVKAATVCRAAAGVCDVAETCPGNSGSCPADAVKTADTVCRAAVDVCDKAETCDGSSTTCPTDAKQPATTPCTADGNPCTLDQCNGTSTTCQHPAGNAGTVCRASAGECDPQETCTGTTTTCPNDSKQPAGTACTDDGDPCTTDTCDGTSNTCMHAPGNAGTMCRAATNECDVAGTCPGAIIIGFRVQGAATASSGAAPSATSLQIGRPSGTQANDVMVASIVAHGASAPPTITPPAGWTLIVNTTSGGQNLAESTYWKVAGTVGTDPGPYIFTVSSSRVAGGISAYFNVDTTNPINAFGGQAGSSTPSMPPITTTVYNTMLVAAFGRSDAQLIGAPSGMTERFNAESSSGTSDASSESADASQATPGMTGSKASTGHTAQVSQLIALAPASSGCPPDTVRAAGAPCSDDRNVCTDDVCNGSTSAPACTHPNKIAPCDDHNDCTTDSCDPTANCGHDARERASLPPCFARKTDVDG